eukprot:gene22564-biopygen27388
MTTARKRSGGHARSASPLPLEQRIRPPTPPPQPQQALPNATSPLCTWRASLSTEPENPCPICLDNDDGATVDGNQPGMCTACGQSFCGACNSVSLVGSLLSCPCCRASFHPPRAEAFRQCWKLVHDRSPGRHTPLAQNQLGFMYSKGDGVEPDAVEAATWFRKAAETGCCDAQCNLGTMYSIGAGVEQDWGEATKWYRTAAEAGHAAAPPPLYPVLAEAGLVAGNSGQRLLGSTVARSFSSDGSTGFVAVKMLKTASDGDAGGAACGSSIRGSSTIAQCSGGTPLSRAAFGGHHKAVIRLLELGCDPRLHDAEGGGSGQLMLGGERHTA